MSEDGPAPLESTPASEPPGLPAAGAAFPVVGVGASAGGLEALTQLLRTLPVDTGMGFVIVQHLAPERASGLAEILSRATRMPVREVRDEPVVKPNHVYVIPPGREMVIAGGKLRLLEQERGARNRGIDQFFHSLAEDSGHQAIGVVLSGALTDGTLGMEEIKAEGGITFAQDDSAQHGSMPRSAVASGCVDFVLSPAAIAREIARIARHPHVVLSGQEAAVAPESGHARIVEILHGALGVDFTNYKANTLHRRITRRMVLHKLDTLSDYETHLKGMPGEIEALYQDILISVTSFFRDPAAFAALKERVYPRLLAGRTLREPVRFWTLGCSTGEEAYSLAMAFMECAEAAGSDVPLQIFATDLNQVGVARARTGLYAKSIAQEVSPERLRRFFTEEDAGYRVCKLLRERCVFSRHNVLGDPPFSRVDFISCRNVLIYMEPVLQQRIMPLLHYALKPGGYLWLGSSEMAGTSRALFEIEDARHKIYVRQPGASPSGIRFRPGPGSATTDPSRGVAAGVRVTPRAGLPGEVERVLLAKYAPPGVVVSAAMEIVQFRGDTGPYLAPAPGAPSLNLFKMLREELLVSVRAALLRAGREGGAVREGGLRVRDGSGFRELAVQVIPLQSEPGNERGFLVLFERVPAAGGETAVPPGAAPPVSASGDGELSRVIRELAATREYLQSVVEQQEAVNGDLQSANEEAQSANEELQSVNEELETSKEEIQSSNEELATVNDELGDRNLELQRINDSLKLSRDYAENVIASLRSPLLVLDGALRVKTASRSFYDLFRVVPGKTEGRLIYDLGNGQWNIPALRGLLEDVLPREERIDGFEVRHTFELIGPRIMLLNARRLSQATQNQPLIILAIEDITDRTQQQAALRRGELRYRRLFESGRDGVLIIDPVTRRIVDANPFIAELLACAREDLLGKELFEIGLLADEAASRAAFKVLQEMGYIRYENLPLETKAGERREVEFVSNIYSEEGEDVIQCNIRDITARRQAEETLRASEEKFESIFHQTTGGIGQTDPDGRFVLLNDRFCQIMGRSREALLEMRMHDVIHPEDLPGYVRKVDAMIAGTLPAFVIEKRYLRPDGSVIWVQGDVSRICDMSGRVRSITAAVTDMTERHQLQESLALRAAELARADRNKDEFLAMLAHELRNPLAPLRNAAEILGNPDADAGASRLALDILSRQVDNMTRMVDDMLDVARITEGKIELRRQPVALETILTAAANLARSGCAANQQRFTLSLPAVPVFLDADATRLEQVFGNLLSNACKYSGVGSHISLEAERAAGAVPPQIVVRVRDDGFGIAPELLPHIFDLFVQASRSLDRAHGGLGIGLTLVQRLVKLHGGTVEARSGGLGLGSEFIVRLPILAEAPPPPLTPAPAREIPRRILIVDDNADAARSLALLQQRRGHQTRTVFTGPDAVAAAVEFVPEVVLLDIGLPGMNGYEVARHLRALPALAGILVVAMSGYSRDEDRAEARRAGFDEYLVKPLDLDRLGELLRNRV